MSTVGTLTTRRMYLVRYQYTTKNEERRSMIEDVHNTNRNKAVGGGIGSVSSIQGPCCIPLFVLWNTLVRKRTNITQLHTNFLFGHAVEVSGAGQLDLPNDPLAVVRNYMVVGGSDCTVAMQNVAQRSPPSPEKDDLTLGRSCPSLPPAANSFSVHSPHRRPQASMTAALYAHDPAVLP